MNPTALFPVYNEDYFLQFRPFPANPTNALAKHWHEVAFSTLFYFTIQALSPAFSRYAFGDTYTKLSYKTKVNFDIHIVSQVQCVISLLLIVPCWNHPLIVNRVADPAGSIFGLSDYHSFAAAITTGYFIWDVYVCARYYALFGVGFLIHGLSALYVFSVGLMLPFVLPWTPSFLIFELSTPFVNMNWFASKMPAGTFSDTFIAVNGIVLMVVFFSVRIVWGFYSVCLLLVDLYKVGGQVHPFFPAMIVLLNMSLNSLNVYWFSRMVAIAKKKIFPPEKRDRGDKKDQ